MKEKRFIEKSRLVEKTFENGGTVINCGFPLEEFQKKVIHIMRTRTSLNQRMMMRNYLSDGCDS